MPKFGTARSRSIGCGRLSTNPLVCPKATHKTPEVKARLNFVERFVAQVTSRLIRRGSHSSVDDPDAAICDYPAQHNEKPAPFGWTRTAEDILTRERRAPDEIRESRWEASDSEF